LTSQRAVSIFKPMKQKKKINSDFVHIGRIINDTLISSAGNESNQDMLMVYACWKDIVGDLIAENTAPASYKKKILVVYVESPTWLHQLQFLKTNIIKKINDALKKEVIKDIKFTVGQLSK
jgi:predicted nucleic acid-binding Zn ribbon protein